MKYPTGFEFVQYQCKPCVVEGYSDNYDAYLIRVDGDTLGCDLWSETQLDDVMSKQERILSYEREQQEREARATAAKQASEAKYNNVFGFCDNMTDLQRGKVLATLNKQVKYKGIVMTRKEWIIVLLSNGHMPEYKLNVNFVGRNPRNYYTLVDNEGMWYEITKTEYEFALYIIEQEAIANAV